MKKMILYHGTNEESAENILKNGIDLSVGNDEADFGKGFYTTPDLAFAEKCARRKAFHSKPSILRFDFDNKSAKDKILNFPAADMWWAQFIVNNRNGYLYTNAIHSTDHNLDARYDIVYGKIADGNIVKLAAWLNGKRREIQRAECKRLINDHYPMQYSFHTKDSLQYIKKIERERWIDG